MASRVSVSVDGIALIEKHLSQLDDKTLRKTIRGVGKAAAHVQGVAKSLAPVDTGLLRGSIHTKISEATTSRVTADVYTNTEYAPYVEFGTGTAGSASGYHYGNMSLSYSGKVKGHAARPFLGRAIYQERANVKAIFQKEMEK